MATTPTTPVNKAARFRKMAEDTSLPQAVRNEYLDKANAIEKEAAKPLTAAQIAAREAEQEKQRAIASELDRKWQKKYWEELGLESAPGKPLASKVIRPPVEVFREYEAQYKPLRECHTREF